MKVVFLIQFYNYCRLIIVLITGVVVYISEHIKAHQKKIRAFKIFEKCRNLLCKCLTRYIWNKLCLKLN